MNTTQIPPGGWQFHQPQTGWWAPAPIAFTHDQQVNNIIKHRLANPAIVAKHRLATDFDSVSRELIQFQQKRGALPGDAPPKLTPPPSSAQMSGGVRAAVAAVRKMASGASAVAEWEQLGLPHVEQSEANSRAEICSKCPKNLRKPLTELFTEPVANMLKKKMERLNDMNLSTPFDDQLFTCDACWCVMRTKVWYPTDLVLKNLKPEHKAELDHSCWILKLQSPTPSFPKAELQGISSPVSLEAGS